MEFKQVYEIDEYRAAIIFNYFDKIHMRLVSGELDFGECDGDVEELDIGDPSNKSMIANLGYMQDTKYVISFKWCKLMTLTWGYVERYIISIEKSCYDGNEVHRIIVERSAEECSGIFCSTQAQFEPTFHPDGIISHLIMKDIAEYPSVRCCAH